MSLQVTTQGCLWEPQIPGSLVCINVLVKKMCCVFPEYCFSEIWRLLRIFALHICIYTIYSDVTADHHSWLKILVRKMLGCVFIFFFTTIEKGKTGHSMSSLQGVPGQISCHLFCCTFVLCICIGWEGPKREGAEDAVTESEALRKAQREVETETCLKL